MAKKAATAKTQSFYDKIADVHNLALKINGYRASVAKYLRLLDLDIGPDSYVLDAGSGTGIVTLGFQDAGFRPKRTVAFDLSGNSLEIARDQFRKEKRIDHKRISPVQGNVLELPFAAETFEEIFRYTGGVPRLINTLCDTAMMAAFAAKFRTATLERCSEPFPRPPSASDAASSRFPAARHWQRSVPSRRRDRNSIRHLCSFFCKSGRSSFTISIIERCFTTP